MMMNMSNYMALIATRGLGKSFLIAVFACARCILYPGTKVCIASGTRGQAVNVLEKIKTELMPNSENLRNEILSITITAANAIVYFNNGSFIKVVTASDSSRGNRANILIVDEFRLVDKQTIDMVLTKFLTSPRAPGYLNNPEYAHLQERNKEYYLSSAYFKSHWSYEKTRVYAEKMLDDTKKYFVCGLPYQLAVSEGLFIREAIEDQMTEADFNEVKFSMEMECIWFGDEEGSFFSFDEITKCRTIQTPWLLDEVSSKLNDKRFKIPIKQSDEKRFLSADIALMTSKKHNNDASAIFINQLIPNRAGRYTNNIVYTESSEGEHAEDQALRIRKLFDGYNCDYIIIDVKGVGASVYEYLVRDIIDPETGDVYPAVSCYNNEELAARCKVPNAKKIIWAMNATSKINSDCAILLREGFRSGKIRLMNSEYEVEPMLCQIKGFASLSPYEKLKIQSPYINTTELINELIKLQHDESSGLVKMFERYGERKDRYSSLSYNIYVSSIIERDLAKPRQSFKASSNFAFRQPQFRYRERR
ncbi:MAG: terminase family protein [Bacteroides sp.]